MESIYTIPINEAFGRKTGCPFCSLESTLENDLISYTLGAAMMEPNVRIEMNRLGFCRDHFTKLANNKGKLSLALILESRLAELLSSGKSVITGECFICNKINASNYISNAVYMYDQDAEFQKLLQSQEFFCLTHLKAFLSEGKNRLKRKQYDLFENLLFTVEGKYIESLKKDARLFADSYDYRNSGKELGGEKYVLQKAISLM